MSAPGWRLGLGVVGLLAILLAGCGRGPEVTPTVAPLVGTYRSEDGTLSFRYPEGWSVTAMAGQVTLANSSAAAEASRPAPGQFQSRMIVGPIDAVSGLDAGATPREVIQFFAETLAEGGDVQYGQPSDVRAGAFSGARVDVTATDGEGLLVALDLTGGAYAIVSAISYPSEMARFEPTLEAILATVEYAAPDSAG